MPEAENNNVQESSSIDSVGAKVCRIVAKRNSSNKFDSQKAKKGAIILTQRIALQIQKSKSTTKLTNPFHCSSTLPTLIIIINNN